MKRKPKWIRTETPDVFHIRVSISKEKYPELHKWLSELPMGSISETVRKALACYMTTEGHSSVSNKDAAIPASKQQTVPRSDEQVGISGQEEKGSSTPQTEPPAPASSAQAEKPSSNKAKTAKKIPDHLLRAAKEYRIK